MAPHGMQGRDLPDPLDPLAEPERRLTVDDYTSQVRAEGSRTQASPGTQPESGGEAADLEERPPAEPG